MDFGDNLIQKYLSNELNDSELEKLSIKLQEDEKFRFEFQAQLKQQLLIDQWRLRESQEKTLECLEQSGLFNERQHWRVKHLAWIKYAAAVVVAILSTYAVLSVIQRQPELETDAIVLTLGDGTTRVIQEKSDESILEERGKQLIDVRNDTLNYLRTSGVQTGDVVFNELSVPHGKRYHLRLSDGTLVFLNSGSHLRFPVNLKRQASREVYLSGEAYFEVSKDSLHPFIVHADEIIHVRVLGTHFDVRAYPDDAAIKTSLAEGKVEVSLMAAPATNAILIPGQAATWAKEGERLKLETVNLENEMAWVKNRLLFVDEPFAEVIKKIERSYGVRIENDVKDLDLIRFNGDFDIEKETVDEVMKAFAVTGYFNYTRRNHTITIKKQVPMQKNQND